MLEFFVWSTPKLIRLIDAANEQEAVESFIDGPTTGVSSQGKPPDCFVQAISGLDAPCIDDTTLEFWRAGSDPDGRDPLPPAQNGRQHQFVGPAIDPSITGPATMKRRRVRADVILAMNFHGMVRCGLPVDYELRQPGVKCRHWRMAF